MSQDINKVECTEQITKDCYCYVCVNGTFRRAKISDLLALVDADEVTPETIEAALEYVPADQEDVDALLEELNKKQPSGDYALRSELPTVPVQSVNGKTGAVSLGATDIGADASGTAGSAVSEHNTAETAHNDIRLLIEGLTSRLNALANSDDLTLDQMAEVVAYIKNNKSLIDSITTSKVNVSDIVDNLETSVSGKPLSAKQGVTLKALIDAIVIPTLLLQLGEDESHRTVTDTEKAAWNAKSNFSGAYEDLTGKPTIPTSLPASDVYEWAKQPTKPGYTAGEVGADPSGTADSKVAAHNTAAAAHNDIRLLIEGLTSRLNALANSDDTTLDQMAEVVAYIKNNKSLIDAITTSKVNVSDIINNLETNVSNKPLSAAQGVALKTLIDAVSASLSNYTPMSYYTALFNGFHDWKDDADIKLNDLEDKDADLERELSSLSEQKADQYYATPQQFGAKADGITDDTQAIMDAIASLGNGGTLFFPKGIYQHTGIEITKPCEVIGESYRNTTLRNTSNGNSITIKGNGGGTTLKNLSVMSTGTDYYATGATAKKGIVIESVSYITLEYMNVTQHTEDLLYIYNSGHANNIYINNSIFRHSAKDGVTIVQANYDNQINAINIHQSDVAFVKGNGINLWGCNINVDSCTIQACGSYGISVDGTDARRLGDSHVMGLCIKQNYFETCNKAFIYLHPHYSPVASYINGALIEGNYGTYGIYNADAVPSGASCVKIVSHEYDSDMHTIGGLVFQGNGFISNTDGVPVLDAGGNLNEKNYIYVSWLGGNKSEKFVNLGKATVFNGRIMTLEDADTVIRDTVANLYTPQKGVDYWTDEDKEEIKSEGATLISSELAKRTQLKPEFADTIEQCTDSTKLYVLPDGFIYADMTKEVTVIPTNRIPLSTNADGTLYNNGQGWKTGVILAAGNGNETTSSSAPYNEVTGFIPLTQNDILRIKDFETSGAGSYDNICLYDSSYAFLGTFTIGSAYNPLSQFITDGVFEGKFADAETTNISAANRAKLAYVRLSFLVITDDTIVTVNEPLEPTTSTVKGWQTTGRAFVPADYESRILSLEEEIEELKSKMV